MGEKQAGSDAVTVDKADTSFNPENASVADGAVENGITAEGMKLHPQPTGDPLDPLNWSTTRKHVILGIVMFKYVHKLPFSATAPVTMPHFLKV